MKTKTLYHLSHTDLDGYSCQFVMSKTKNRLFFYNANYGAEIKQTLEEMLRVIAQESSSILLLISDLNLNIDEAKWLDAEVQKLKDAKKDITLQLLDHHLSGMDCAKKFSWYYLDDSKCATKLVYEFAKSNLELDDSSELEQYVNIVNAVDIWKKDEVLNFEFGKVLMRLIGEARELNKIMFPKDDNSYKLYLISKALPFIKNFDYIGLDDAIHQLKKSYFMQDRNDTIDNLSSMHIVKLLSLVKDEKSIYYKGYKGYLSYALGNTSIIGNDFLVANDEYDFIADVSYRGTISFRANSKVDVSLIAKEWCGGGGHPNASGGRVVGFKEQFVYSKVKEQILNIINEKESKAGELAYKE